MAKQMSLQNEEILKEDGEVYFEVGNIINVQDSGCHFIS